MASRIAQIVEFKAGGKATAFADMMGWSKQYLNKLLHGESIGINVVTSIVQKFPDLNARWLLTGNGNMVDTSYIKNVFAKMVSLERFIPVMTEEEQQQMLTGTIRADQANLTRWEAALNLRNEAINERFRAAYERQKSGKTCK